jgi:alpha-methylacyl-CoA racemase
MSGLVLDLSRLLPGPLAGKILATMGMDVIRVLPPQGDYLQVLSSALYDWVNTGKASEVIDLKTSVGRSRLFALTQQADVLLESNRPGVMERLHLGPEFLKAVNPRLVYVRVAGYRDPTQRTSPGHDITYLAAAGLLPRLDPAWKQIQLSDLVGAFWIALAALDGLRHQGGFYELYLDDACAILGYPPLDCVDGSRVCYSVYRCLEGEIALAAIEPHFWQRFCTALRRGDWIGSAFTRAVPSNSVYQSICSVFAGRSARNWEAWALRISVPLRRIQHREGSDVPLPWSKRF